MNGDNKIDIIIGVPEVDFASEQVYLVYAEILAEQFAPTTITSTTTVPTTTTTTSSITTASTTTPTTPVSTTVSNCKL